MNNDIKIITTNRKAFRDYHILEKLEAGIELVGSEVKSLREGRANLKNAYATFREGGVVLIGMHIGPYSHTGFSGHEPYRDRRLLLHQQEIRKLKRKVSAKGHTLVPLKVYFKRGWVKIEIALATGKRTYDKKAVITRRDQERAMERELKDKRRA